MKSTIFMVIGALAIGAAVVLGVGVQNDAGKANAESAQNTQSAALNTEGLAVATFAGGCFWCVESRFEKIPGVTEAISGYAGGNTDNPTYYDVGAGNTGHTEAVQIHYNPSEVSFDALLYYLWREIDPTDANGQFVDRGDMYRPAVFYHDDNQKQAIDSSLAELAASNRYGAPLAVEVLPYSAFWKAEEYHQDYYKKSPLRYKVYRHGSGRDQFLEKTWGEDLHVAYPMPVDQSSLSGNDGNSARQYSKPPEPELRNLLTDIQYRVTQHDGTERPYQNEYWNNKRDGIYVDVVSGEPLFSSTDKYKSGTGWPSFTQPIDKQYVKTNLDFKLGLPRTEVRSKFGDSHLGHVFKDGPAPTGLRYCINSASLRFVSKDNLAQEGYSQYTKLF